MRSEATSPASALAAFDFGEQQVQGGVIEDLGERTLAGRAGQRGGRVVLAQTLVGEKSEEAPKRGGLARDAGALQVAPRLAERAEPILGRNHQRSAEQLGRAAQIPLISEQGVARGSRLRRHHFKEGGDELAVFPRPSGHGQSVTGARSPRPRSSALHIPYPPG
jgi:hypothetical protein